MGCIFMKKRALLLSLLLAASLTACGGEAPSGMTGAAQPSDSRAEVPAEPEEIQKGPTVEVIPPLDNDADRQYAFGQILWRAYLEGILPDGTPLDWNSTEGAAENDFALYDVDGDGQEELLLIWGNACMAGMGLHVFGYAEGNVYEELSAFPAVTFYDNGIVKENWSHNQGLAGNTGFWPYTFSLYNAETDRYERVGSVDAWSSDQPAASDEFPTDIDADGDGMVYFLLPVGWEGSYSSSYLADGAEYKAWRNSYLENAQPLNIADYTQKLTEDNIALLGCPKPEVSVSEPVG